MGRILTALLIIFILGNFAEYKALAFAYKTHGFSGVLRMMLALVVHLISSILPD